MGELSRRSWLAGGALALLPLERALAQGLTFEGKRGAGRGKHIVLVSGDEEYRSEEAMPQLARILATHHGFRCTVLFAIDPATGKVNPNHSSNIPGLEALRGADLMILFIRFRDLPDEQMRHIAEYVESGRPIVALRTSTHAFAFKKHEMWKHWGWDSKEWDGGFGRQVLGETWISHHGAHGKESTRGVIAPERKDHPIVRGIGDGEIWGPTDVYTVRLPLPDGCEPLVYGQVLRGMRPDDPPVEGAKNDPMMPVAWTRIRGKARIFTTTMGSSQDLSSEGFRRLLVNAAYWALGMESKIPAKSKVDLVGEYNPTPFRFNGFREGLTPPDFAR
ncbi:MAG: ThuA domain-containing protein [Bryobacteraceae bacterium]